MMKKTIVVAGTAALFAASVAMASDLQINSSGKESPVVKQRVSELSEGNSTATIGSTTCGGCAGSATNTACCAADDCGAVD